MSDVNANIGVHIDTSAALTELKNLQRQIATFHSQISKSSATAAMAQKNLQTNLLNAINATGKFHAQMGVVRTSTESFTNSLEKNKLSMREYFRYAGGASKSFGKLFKQEFDTIGKVAEERVKKMQTQYIKMGRDASGAMKAMSITPNTLDMKDYGTQLAITAQKQALFNQLVKQGSTNLLNFGKNTQWAGRQLMVGFTVPLMYLGTAAAKTFMDLEQQAIKFKRVYGDMFTTSDETNKALEDVKNLAQEFTKYGVAVSKTMEMAASAAAMGKTGADLTSQVAQATRLAVLGNVEQEQALETTISLTNAFGIAAEDLTKKINFLNAVENQTVVSIEDLTIAIPKAGPVVQQLGGDVEDLAFFLTAMKEGGINASEGANALKSGLASLINPTEKAAKMLNGLGVNIKAIVEGNAGNIRETVIDFAQALDTLAPLERSRAIEQLFGKFQFARLSTLFQNITKDGTQASRVLGLAGKSVEELAILSERELKTVEDAVGTNFKAAVEQLKVAIAPIGKTFLETVTPIIKGLGNIFDKFNNLGEGTQKFIVVMTTLVGLIGPTLLMTFGLLANGAANIIKLFLVLRTGFLKLTGNTKILGESTQYLNSEQLEAATVAASLNQAHTKLTQSFKLEATAVIALRDAYVQATTAATKFALANPGMMVPGAKGKAPKKFSRGATYVPGTGNKDTVPSMLTPGEAVIPRGVAQDPKFQPIIDAMVNGKLQGFSTGTSAVVAFGAHQPFTTAHEDIANQAKLMAEESGSKFIQYTSAGTQSKKGVVSLENRIKQITESVGQVPTIAKNPFDLMRDLQSKGITDVKFLLGSDRMESTVFDDAARQHGVKLTKIEVPRIPGDNEVSATKLRKAVASGDLETAERLLAKGTSEETKKLIFDEIKQNSTLPKPKKSAKPKKDAKIAFGEQEFNAKTSTSAQSLRTLLSRFELQPDGEYKFRSSITGRYEQNFDKNGIPTGDRSFPLKTTGGKKGILEYLSKYSERDDLNIAKITKAMHIEGNGYDPSIKRNAPSYYSSFLNSGEAAKIRADFDDEIAKVIKANDALPKDQRLSKKAMDDYVKFQLQHLSDPKRTPLWGKDWDPRNLAYEPGLNNYLNRVRGDLGKNLLNDEVELKKLKINKGELQKLVDGDPPRTKLAAETMLKLADYDFDNAKGADKGAARAAQTSLEARLARGYYNDFKTVAQVMPETTQKYLSVEESRRQYDEQQGRITTEGKKTLKKRLSERALKELRQVDADVRSSSMAKVKPTDFGKLVSPTSGRSFPVAGIGGVYEKDGNKVFVKPMVDEKSAKAELRANEIARKVHGLDTPEQVMKVMADPNNKKRKIIVLESKFDPKFAEDNIKKNFTKGEYFKQLVAANLRADADLKKGNLGGNVLTDPGAAGVFDRASGRRDFAKQLPSMLEMAEKNLSGVKGGAAGRSPYWFGNETVSIAKNMTADQYHRAMNAEIDRALKKLEPVIAGFGITDPQEKQVYQAMVDRLKQGKKENWRALHAKHSSLLVKPDEMLEDEKGKLTKPKTKGKPSGTKSSSGKLADSKLTDKPKKGKRIVNVARRGPRGFIVPGQANAPLSQADQIRQRAAQEGISTTTARRRLIAEGQLIQGMKKQSDAINNDIKQTQEAADKKKAFVGKLNTGINAFSGLTIAASFAGGKIGELAGKITPVVVLLSTLTMLGRPLKAGFTKLGAFLALNPIVAVVAALAGLVVAYKVLDSKTKEQAAAQSRYIDSVSATTEKMKKIGEITGQVGASEIMSTRRQGAGVNTFSDDLTRAGQQFGTNFLGSEVGKQMLASFQDNLVKGGSNAVKQVALELSSYISDGIMTAEQANSIAKSIGINLSDMSLSTKIEGELSSIIGPNGEKLESEPLKVRLQIIQETGGTQQDYLKSLQEIPKNTAGKLGSELAASASAMGAQTLETIRAQRDAQAKLYDDQIRSLKAEKLKTADKKKQKQIDDEIIVLQDKAAADDKSLASQRQKSLDVLLKTYQTIAAENKLNFGPSDQEKALFASAQEQVKLKFPEDPYTKTVISALSGLSGAGSEQLELKLLANMGSGDMTPMQVNNLLKLYDSDVDAVTKILNTDIAMKSPEKFAQLQNLIGGIEGKNAKAVGVDIIAKMTAKDGQEKFDSRLAALELLSKLDNKEINLAAYLETNGLVGLDKLADKLMGIENMPDVTQKSVEIKLKELGMDASGIQGVTNNWEYFASLPDNIRKQALQVYTSLYETFFKDDASRLAFYAKYKTGGNATAAGHLASLEGGRRDAEYVAKATETIIPRGTTANIIPGSGEDIQDAGGSRDTTLDNLLNRLKMVRDAGINAAGGVKELLRITKGDGISKFSGTMQQLLDGVNVQYKSGLSKNAIKGNREFLSFIENMDEETRKTYLNISKNGKVTFTAVGAAANEAFNEKPIGDFQEAQRRSIADTMAQRDALIKLRAAGVDNATALEMVADATLAVAINSKDISSTELKNMAKNAKEAKNEVEALNLALKQTAEEMKKDTANLALTVDVLQKVKKAQPNVSEDVLSFIASRIDIVQELARGFAGVGENAKEIDSILANVLKQKDFKVKISLEIDMVGELQSQLDAIGTKMSNYFAARKRQVEAAFRVEMRSAQSVVNARQLDVEARQRDVRNIQNEIDAMERNIESKRRIVESSLSRPIEELQKSIDVMQREIELKFSRPVEELQAAIEKIERNIELNIGRAIETLQDESNKLSNDLTIMDKAAEAINKKYDLQAEALDKISQINQDIIAQDTKRISLADALSSGDISAAAQAIQDLRQGSAAAVSKSTQDLLNAAKQAELDKLRTASGLTRLQVEERQFQISQQVYQLELQRKLQQDQIVVLQDRIYALEQLRKIALDQIRVVEDEIYAKEQLRKLEMEKIQVLEDAILAKKIAQLEPAQLALEQAERNLDLAQQSLDAIQQRIDKDLAAIQALEDQWTAVTDMIDAAEVAAFNFTEQLKEALDIATKLAAAIAAKANTPPPPPPPPPPVDTPSLDATKEAADAAAAALAAADAAAAPIDAATEAAIIAADKIAADAAAVEALILSSLTTSRNALLAKAQAGMATLAKQGDPGAQAYVAEQERLLAVQKQQLQFAALPNAWANRGVQAAYSSGGMVKPKYFSVGGAARGTDIIPAMLTPGEFVMSKYAVSSYGIDKMKAINNGTYEGEKVYNYNLSVNVKSDSNPDEIARVVIKQIQQLDNQRIRKQGN